MLYHVRTGDINTKTSAKNPRQAAIQAIRYSKEAAGVCIIVGEHEILEESCDSHFYFFTESIMEEALQMRLVR